jgi:phosphopantothenoylcysteine decarboxylase/phosphopantothenate--cysteine ligase
MQAFPEMDAAIMCAAVADFRPATVADKKIKREGDDLVLTLKPNHDIAAALGIMKKEGQKLVGFALETDHEMQNADKKLAKKNLDMIVLNSLRNEGTCFRSDDNQIVIISKSGSEAFPKASKKVLAIDIVEALSKLMK